MKVFQTYLKVFLLKEIKQEDALNVIASFIDHVLVKNPAWEKMHNENCFKGYSFNSFYPQESDGVYKKERVYQVMIRSVNLKLLQYLDENLPKHENLFMKGLICNSTVLQQKHVTTLYSITPLIVKGKEQSYWRDEMNVAQFDERLKINLVKKYRAFVDPDLTDDFELHTLLEFRNRSPIAVPYKGIKLLADKVQMQIADNDIAQKLAFFALGVGVGELNSRGMGNVNAHFA